MEYNGQSAQDLFVLKCLSYKQRGTYVEIGSYKPIYINNTYLLETKYNWKGIMVEMDGSFLNSYKEARPTAHHIIQDATTIDFLKEFQSINLPSTIDYLQVDLEVSNKSTITTLENLYAQVMNTYTFATVTFEHDIYSGDHYDTRKRSREIFDTCGYVRVFSDVKNNNNPYEDWYVHPSLVDMNYINRIKSDVSMEYTEIISRL